jgi:hypothetical protein
MSSKKIGFLALIIALMVGRPGLGQPNNPYACIWHCTGADSGEFFGAYFASIRDQNNDGYDDILVAGRKMFTYILGTILWTPSRI